ncbi:unnamed protein product [Alternaria alternata]
MSCQLLKLARAQSPEKLIKMAFEVLPERTLQAVFGTLHPKQHRILEQQRRRKVSLHCLADTLYHHQGAQLSRLGRWNDMTILQMQHELAKRGKLEEGEATTLSEWKLRLRLVCLVTAEKEAWRKAASARLEKRTENKKAWAAQLAAYDEIDKDLSEGALVEAEHHGIR